MSDEREFLECEIADAMESDEDVRPEVAAIIEARSERDSVRAQLAQRDGELEALRAVLKRVKFCPFKSKCGDCARDIDAALSDNQESPALTDKEEGE